MYTIILYLPNGKKETYKNVEDSYTEPKQVCFTNPKTGEDIIFGGTYKAIEEK